MILKTGTRLYSRVCETEFIAVNAPDVEVELTIGGSPATSLRGQRNALGSVSDGHGGGTMLGKRYVDDAETIELLCTKPGDGMPALNGEVLAIKASKPLPSSD